MTKRIKLGETKLSHKETGLPISPDFKENKQKNSEKHLIFSFESLDLSNPYFTLDGTCPNWAMILIEKLRDYSQKTVTEIVANPSGTIRFHNHSKGTPVFKPPYGLDERDFYQIRFGTSKGGIHGVLVENIFYVIWLDPQHNMYPDDRYGGLKKITPPDTCCKEREQELARMHEQLLNAKKEALQWQELVEHSYHE